jgi:hypothetical protein
MANVRQTGREFERRRIPPCEGHVDGGDPRTGDAPHNPRVTDKNHSWLWHETGEQWGQIRLIESSDWTAR